MASTNFWLCPEASFMRCLFRSLVLGCCLGCIERWGYVGRGHAVGRGARRPAGAQQAAPSPPGAVCCRGAVSDFSPKRKKGRLRPGRAAGATPRSWPLKAVGQPGLGAASSRVDVDATAPTSASPERVARPFALPSAGEAGQGAVFKGDEGVQPEGGVSP